MVLKRVLLIIIFFSFVFFIVGCKKDETTTKNIVPSSFDLHFILLILLECSLPGSMAEFVLKKPDG